MRWLVWNPRGEHPTTAMVRAVRRMSAGSGELGMGEAAYHPPQRACPAVDSATVPRPPTVTPSTPSTEEESVPPGALARLGRLLPRISTVVRWAYRLAAVSAASAGVIVVALASADWTWLTPAALAVLAVVLLLPAAAVAIAGWTLADIASLPGQIREAALAAARREPSEAPARRSRIGGILRSLWAARGLALLSRDGWLKAVGAVRFLRLASLPFMLGLVGFVALNGLVIAGGAVALLFLVL